MYGIYENGKVIARFVVPTRMDSNVPVFSNDALSLKRSVSKRAAQRWELTSNLEPLSYDANELFALFVRKGNFEAIQIIVPQNYGATKANTSNSSITATGTKSATSVTLSAFTGKITVGTMVKFDGHDKIYMTTSNATSGGTVGIFPELRQNVSGSMSYKADVVMNCYLDTETVTGMSYSDGILMDLGTVKLVEKLS